MLQWHEFLCCGEGAGEGDTTAGPVEVPLDEDDHESEGGIAGLAVGGMSGMAGVQFDGGKGSRGRVVPLELLAIKAKHLGKDDADREAVVGQRRRASRWVGALRPDQRRASRVALEPLPTLSRQQVRMSQLGEARRGDVVANVENRAGQESEIPNFKASYLGRFPLVSADFWTSDHLSERSPSVDAFSGTRARGTLTLKRR